MSHIALIGLGLMGQGLAHNLLEKGHSLAVHNRTRERAEPYVARGARWADSPAEAARGARAVISVVADDAASREVWLGEQGALPAMSPGAIAIECSTLSVPWVKAWGQHAAERGVLALDAPLGGSRAMAQAGTIGLYVGGTPEALEAARPVLSAFSGYQTHFGPLGAGTTYKLISNVLSAVHLASLGEALELAERAGLNLEQVAQAITNGAANSLIVKAKIGSMLARDYGETQFALKWMHKDLTYGLQAAEDAQVAMPVAAAVREQFARGLEQGLAERDFAAVREVFDRDAGG